MTLTRPFAVCRFDMDGIMEVLATFTTYERADEALDNWCNRYPGAFINVFERQEDGTYAM